MKHFLKKYCDSIDKTHSEMDSISRSCSPASLQKWLSRERPNSLTEGWELLGCTSGETQEVRSAWGGYMPASAEAFYKLMGKDHGFLKLSSSFSYPAVLEADDNFDEWLEEVTLLHGNRFEIEQPANVVHIGDNDGYFFEFFQERTQDPMISTVGESKKSVWSVQPKELFSHSVLRSIRDCEASMRRLVMFS